MKRFNQNGFGLHAVLLIAGVIVIAGLIGWNVYQRQQDSSDTTVKAVPSAPSVDNVADLDKATEALDKTQIDTVSDTAQLDKDLASF